MQQCSIWFARFYGSSNIRCRRHYALQVHSSAFHHTAITAEGELLVWSREHSERVTKEHERSVTATGKPLPLLGGSSGVRVWRPGMQSDPRSHPTTCGGCAWMRWGPTAGLSTSGKEHVKGCWCTGVPVVLQLLSDKPAVSDVACGLGHTLALLVTGEVRLGFEYCGVENEMCILPACHRRRGPRLVRYRKKMHTSIS